jgi:hypothetical protein
MKQVIRLTESDLHRIVKESVRKILNEYNEDQYKVLDKLDMGIRRAGAEAQYGNQDNAARMLEDILDITRMNEGQLSSIIDTQSLISMLDTALHPIPVDGQQLINLLRKAGSIVKQGLSYQRY